MKKMRVQVNLARCQLYAQCIFAAPEVFGLRGEDTLEFDPRPDRARRAQVLRAARACPVQAIEVGWVDDADEPGPARSRGRERAALPSLTPVWPGRDRRRLAGRPPRGRDVARVRLPRPPDRARRRAVPPLRSPGALEAGPGRPPALGRPDPGAAPRPRRAVV